MFINNEIKKQLEKLSNEEENKKCFDCENQPARWTSLNNGIYLCHECSEEHKNFESGTNLIKSITLEQWNKSQLNIMKISGNKRLKLFLEKYNVPKNLEKKQLYNSKLMVFYRKQLKSEADGELLLDQLPPKEEFWDSYQDNNNTNNNLDSINLNINTNMNINQIKDDLNKNENYATFDNNINNQFIDGHLIDYPKSSITIDEEQYTIAKEKKILEDKLENSVLKKDSLLNEDKDPKYSSVSSDNDNENNTSLFQNSGYIGTIGNIFSSMWNATSSVRERMNEYTIGKSILYFGGKVYDGVVFLGGKIIEKGTDLIYSETTKNIVHKAGEGLIYIAQKITGVNGNSNNNENSSNNYIDISDEVINKNNNNNIKNTSDFENNYGILNDQNENLLA